MRQQAQAIYRKSGLPGKTAFSAYFSRISLSPDLAPDGANSGSGAAPRADLRPAEALASGS